VAKGVDVLARLCWHFCCDCFFKHAIYFFNRRCVSVLDVVGVVNIDKNFLQVQICGYQVILLSADGVLAGRSVVTDKE
jgi:hypothetical protein